MDQTQFHLECLARGWGEPADFLRDFHHTAQVIGETVALTDRQLRRWRRPNPPRPRAKAWRVLHAMFGTGPMNIGFPGPEPPGARNLATTHEGTGAALNRRAFVADSLGAAASLTVPTPDTIGTAHLSELREGLRSLYTLDDAYGGGDVRSLAVRHLRRIRRVINTSSYPDSIGRQLQLLAGETAEQCAWLHYDADEQDPARRYWGDALTTATMLRDCGLEVLVLASLSMQALREHRPRDAYELAQAARHRAKGLGSPALVSLVAAREARALAQMRDDSGSRREMVTAMRMVERATTGRDRPAPDWAAFHGHAEIDFAQALLYSETGHHNAAIPYLRKALAHQDRAYGRNRALYRLTLASNLVHSGEADEAAGETMTALEQLGEVESGRVTGRLAEVRDELTAVDSKTTRETVEAIEQYQAQEAMA